MADSSSDPGIVQGVVQSVFEPGTNPSLVKAMRYSFFALFATLAGMLYLTNGNYHILAMLALSVALYLSMTWFLESIKEAEQKVQREHREKQQQQQGQESKKDQ